MQEEKIDLSNLGDDDLVSIDEKLYKTTKLKQITESLSQSITVYFGEIAVHYKAIDLGLVRYDRSSPSNYLLPQEFMENGFSYKFIKLGFSGWHTGLFRLLIKTYLSLNESEENITIPHYNFSGVDFEEEDILSFAEDKFCTVATVKDVFQKTFEHDKFYGRCSSIFANNIPELKDAKSFLKDGKKIRFLRVETAKWQDATLRISFELETKTDLEVKLQSVEAPSPLDEIRNIII